MIDKSFFNAESYFRGLAESNILARDNGFAWCTCSGIEGLEGPMQLMRQAKAFFCLDDTNDGSLVRGRSGGWFKNRTFTVFIMHRYRASDMADREAKLGICRELFRQVVARMLVDERDLAKDMVVLQPENILCREFGHQFLPDVTGLYFMVDIAEPVNLVYSSSEWQS